MDYSILRKMAGISFKTELLAYRLTVYNFAFLNENALDFFQSHAFHEFVFPLSGDLSVDIAGKIITVHEGELLYVGPQELRKLKIYPDVPIQCVSLSFDFSPCRGKEASFPIPWLQEEQSLLRDLSRKPYQIAPDSGCVRKEFGLLCECLEQNLTGSPSKLKNDLSNLLLASLQSLSGNQVRPSSDYDLGDTLVNKAIRVNEYIRQNFTRDITVQSVADVLNYSPRHLQRIIMDYYSISFSDLLTQYRVAYAKSLLGMADDSMETVAEKCGFPNMKCFEKNFHKRVGITPSAFKKIFGKFPPVGKGENNGPDSDALFHGSGG